MSEWVLSLEQAAKAGDDVDTSHLWPEEKLFMPGDEELILPESEIVVDQKEGFDLDTRLNNFSYEEFFRGYKPTQFAIEYINFIKMVNGSLGEENESPIIHYDMIDQLSPAERRNFYELLFVAFRGSAKTTALHEYMILYLATYGSIPGFGRVDVGIYVSDTMENGVKSMRNNLEFRWANSDFLREYVPKAKFTDIRWEFENADGKKLAFRGFGATTGVRGFKEYGQRPTWCGMDDLMSDKNAESPTITKDIKKIVYRAARQALHPKKRMILWTGTPFNKSDPLYEACASGAWNTRVYPICDKYPVSREAFHGGWEDRFSYDFVANEHRSLSLSGELQSFNQELMLRITSDEERLVLDSDLIWYNRDKVIQNKQRFNFYITSDLATKDTSTSDFSVILVWAYSNNGDWLLVDGICEKQLMDKNINDLFNFAAVYRPLEVGIEINGQQGGFIQWIKGEMITRNIFFNLAGQVNKTNQTTTEGIRRTGRKIDNFKMCVPLFKAKKIWLPIELRNDKMIVELLEELRYATQDEFKSKNDDVGDGVSMLMWMNPYKPSAQGEPEYIQDETGRFAYFNDDDPDVYKNSTVF